MAVDFAIEGIKEFAQSGAGPVADFFKHFFGVDVLDMKASAAADGAGATYDTGREVITPENVAELLGDLKKELASLKQSLEDMEISPKIDADIGPDEPLTYANVQRLILECDQAIADIEAIQAWGVWPSEYPEARLVYGEATQLRSEANEVVHIYQALTKAGAVFS